LEHGCMTPPPMRQLHACCCQRQDMLECVQLSLLLPARGCPRAEVAGAACGLGWEGVLQRSRGAPVPHQLHTKTDSSPCLHSSYYNKATIYGPHWRLLQVELLPTRA
jgi:hypothetical protein